MVFLQRTSETRKGERQSDRGGEASKLEEARKVE